MQSCCVALFLIIVAQSANGQSVTLDFEDIPANTRITTQYSSKGIVFSNAFLDKDNNAQSGSRVLRSDNPGEEFDTGALEIKFLSNQSSIEFLAGSGFPNLMGTLKVFDNQGNMIGQDGPKPVTSKAYNTVFSISLDEAKIRKATLHYTGTAFESIDNLSFTGEQVPEMPTTPPIIESFEISGIGSNNIFTNPQILLTGVIQGESILSPAKLIISKKVPEGSLAPREIENSIRLNITGNVASFSAPWGLSLGEQAFILKVENVAGLVAEKTIRPWVIPELFAERINVEGGIENLGQFLFNGNASGCNYMVFEQKLIGSMGSNTFKVEGEMLEVWLNRKDNAANPELGCPIGEEVIISQNVSYQEFSNGVLYLDGDSNFKVPELFFDVIKNHRREDKEWIPTMNNTQLIQTQTEMFQRFRREGNTEAEITIEVRGNPQKLYIERGRGGVIEGILTKAPVWDVYDCFGPLGPCNFNIDTPPLSDPDSFCNNQSYEGALGQSIKSMVISDPSSLPTSLPAAWEPVNGQYTQTHVQGVVKNFKKADWDLWFTHESMEFPQAGGVDWNLDVIPNPGFRNVLTTERNYVHVEWESLFSNHFFAFGFNVAAGYSFFTSGRWIIDCGHPTFKSEIHPPSVIASTVTQINNATRIETVSYVWVNGYYSGEAVDFYLFPPPRPTPSATLNSTKSDSGAPMDINIENNLSFQGMRIKINATRKENEVTRYGLFKWDTGRSYESKWTLFWTE